MRLCIADPPYPPLVGQTGRIYQRASRWYGDNQLSKRDQPADVHPEAAAWDDPATHRVLLERLLDEYDGFAIATTPDGIAAYGSLPSAVRLAAWVRPNAQPGSHRIRSTWEAVIVYPPSGRRSNRNGNGSVPNVLIEPVQRRNFIGSKPPRWTAWVLQMLSYQEGDTVDDLFHGSGAVAEALASLTN